MKHLHKLRYEYRVGSLDENSSGDDPLKLFEKWLRAACKTHPKDPNAMVLSSVDKFRRPASRVVLLKEFSQRGFVFFTNYESRKGQELKKNPYVATTFFWPLLERQVRIEGSITKLSSKENQAYFAARPRDAQLSAWASSQSDQVSSRKVLEQNLKTLEQAFQDRKIPCPPYWGGYLIKPRSIEFWQGRENRLHDRIVFSRSGKTWKKSRISP